MRAYAIDFLINSADNVLDPQVEDCIVSLLVQGRIRFVWLGMPCTTFSVARRHDGIGPPPLRSDACPMGLSNLCRRDQQKLNEGNQLLFFTGRILWYCYALRIPFVLENPWSSRCWQTPLLRSFSDLPHITLLELHFCQFNEKWKKPTALMVFGLDLDHVAKQCAGTNRICSATGKPHVALKGIGPDKRFMTLIAQPYPFQLVEAIADALQQQLTGAHSG